VRASKKLRNDELLITILAASRLRMELDRIPLWRGDNVPTRQVIDDFARYLYLPRVQAPEILARAMVDGVQLLTWSKDSFAYADSFDDKEGRYRGLRCGQMVTISASEPTGLLVKPDVAAKQQEAERPPETTGPTGGSVGTPPAGGPTPPGAPAAQLPTRFHGSVRLDATRVGPEGKEPAAPNRGTMVPQLCLPLMTADPSPCLDLYPALGDLRTSVSSCRQNSGGSRGILAP
jgi:hypothetical protein